MNIFGAIALRLAGVLIAFALLFSSEMSALAQRNAQEPKPTPMRRAPADTDLASWHTIIVTPKSDVPKIHFYDKLNPIWWLQNADDPDPPDWYLPHDNHRNFKWRFRNPFHNFDHYVIGIADKKFHRSGRYPARNSDPHGGWNFAVSRRKLVVLPFVSYERTWCTFYFGWREHGAFGMEFRFHHKEKSGTANQADKSAPKTNGK